MDFTIRPFPKTAAAYDALSAIHTAAWGEAGLSGDNRQRHDEKRNPTFFFDRIVATVDGEIVAYAAFGENAWNHTPGKYDLDIVVHPQWRRQGIGNALYRRVLAILQSRTPAPKLLTATTREDQPGALALLAKHDFVQVMRSPLSRLDVRQFDATRFVEIQTRLQSAGITLASMSQLRTRDPDWKRHWYDLECAINADHPMPDRGDPLPFATFAGYLDTPLVNLDAAFFAVDTEGTYVGQSTLDISDTKSKTLHVGMTGVVRSHRRQGIATALKVHTIEFARAYGAHWIQTSNEENSPMFQLNRRLGFQPAAAWLNFEKR